MTEQCVKASKCDKAGNDRGLNGRLVATNGAVRCDQRGKHSALPTEMRPNGREAVVEGLDTLCHRH